MKFCPKCKQNVPQEKYNPSEYLRKGGWCRSCKNANRNYSIEYQKKRQKRVEDPEYDAAERQKRNEYSAKIRRRDPWKKRHYEGLRRAAKNRATPKWLSRQQKEEIKRFYKNCPEGYEVDHIHPLLGETFTGLHVPWNLQYLPVSENRRKGNRIVS